MQKGLSTEHVWKLLGHRLRSFFLARLNDDELAADMVQEAFLRIHQHLPTIRDEQRLIPWVFRIARNLVTDHYRSRARSETPTAAEVPSEMEMGDAEANLNAELGKCVSTLLDTLPAEHAEPLRLYERDGLSQHEIADKLGLTLTATKSRIQRSRAKLRVAIEACCAVEADRRGNILDIEVLDPVACERCDEATQQKDVKDE